MLGIDDELNEEMDMEKTSNLKSSKADNQEVIDESSNHSNKNTLGESSLNKKDEKQAMLNLQDSDSDSDIGVTMTRKKNTLCNSDSESEDDLNTNTPKSPFGESEGESNGATTTQPKVENQLNGAKSKNSRFKSKIFSSDEGDSEDDTRTGQSSSQVLNTSLAGVGNCELFDAEMSGSESSNNEDENKTLSSMKGASNKSRSSGSSGSGSEGSRHSDEGYNDSDDDQPQLSAKMLNLLKKGAAKDPNKKSSRPQRQKRSEVNAIHSESQRIVRESMAHIPYHQPKPMSLSDILKKTQERQQKFGICNMRKQSAVEIRRQEVTLRKQCMKDLEEKQKQKERLKLKRKAEKSEIAEKLVPKLSIPEKDLIILADPKDNVNDLPDLDLSKQVSDPLRGDSIQPSSQINTENSDPNHIDTNSNGDKQNDVEDSGFLSTPMVTSEESNGHENDDIENERNGMDDTSVDKKITEDVSTDNVKDVDIDAGKSEEKENKDYSNILVVPESVEIDDEVITLQVPMDDTDNINTEDEVLETIAINVNEDNDKTNIDTVNDTEENVIDTQLQSQTSKTPNKGMLNAANLDCRPKLSGGPDMVVDLDLDDPSPSKVGVSSLMDRLMKHSKRKTPKKKKNEVIETVTKEVDEDGREELKLNTMTITLGEDEEDTSNPKMKLPGAKLVKLKEKLAATMAAKRAEARQKRAQLQEMDNEEGYEEENDAILDEDAELTDQTDTDGEVEYDDEEEMEEMYGGHKKKKKRSKDEVENPFLDKEAEADEEEEDEDCDADDESDEQMNLHLDVDPDDNDESSEDEDSSRKKLVKRPGLNKSKTLNLFDDSEDDDDVIVPKSKQHRNKGEKPFNLGSKRTDPNASASSLDTSFEFEGSIIPGGQPGGGMKNYGKKNGRGTPEMFTQFGKPGQDSNSKTSNSRLAQCTLPIEDSQDLFNSPLQSQQGESTPRNQPDTQADFHFALEEDTHSQLLDSDGFLRLKSTAKKPAKRSLHLGDSGSQDMNELIGLCSGNFSEATQKKTTSKAAAKSLFGASGIDKEDQSMDELIGLCSGNFSEGTQNFGTQKFGTQMKTYSKQSQKAEESDNESNASFDIGAGTLSDHDDSIVNKENIKIQKNDIFSDEEGSESDNNSIEDADENEDDESEEEDDDEAKPFKGLIKKGRIREEFLEGEAELSGSEVESDENLDLDENEDIMEVEEGDKDDVGPEEHLRDQVGRVHLKTIIDEDDRQIKLMQEMYLPDGDLYAENGGRQRRFRWANIDSNSQQDLFNHESDQEDDNEAEHENEAEWRMKRLEREKWLEEQREKEEDAGDDSQLLKLGKIIFKQKQKRAPAGETSEDPSKTTSVPKKVENVPKSPATMFKFSQKKHGSFLSRDQSLLQKIVGKSKSVSNPNGPRNSKNFVFAAVSPNEKAAEEKKPAVKRSSSYMQSTLVQQICLF
ncbi:unnamed protein product [Owenia fusiformis]|uniref:Claspin n=1 Tax=Owenia fusiformis TaxID=6347 RepID=A0A8S4PA34_OWEFU|nr:unnamed protein product [Owenia fusiformis]